MALSTLGLEVAYSSGVSWPTLADVTRYFFIMKLLIVCPFDITVVSISVQIGSVNRIIHICRSAVIAPTDRPKSVNNGRVIEHFRGVFVLSLFLFSVGIGAFCLLNMAFSRMLLNKTF